MSKHSQPPVSPKDEFAVLDEPVPAPVVEAAAPPAPEPPTEAELVKEAEQVVVESSAPTQPEAYRVLNTKQVCLQGSVMTLKPGRVMRVDHYPAGTIENLRRGGVDFERIA